MDTYQRLVELLPGTPDGAARGNAKTVAASAADLPLANPSLAAQEAEQLLDGMLGSSWSGSARVLALQGVSSPVDDLCAGIEQRLGAEFQPLPPASAARAALAQRLQWKLACNAAAGVAELCAPAGKLPVFKGRLAAAALAAAIEHAGQTLLWAYRRYQAPPAGVWMLLHALHGFAAGLGDEVSAAARGAYVRALLLAAANPYRFSARELDEADAVSGWAARLCGWLREGGDGLHVDAAMDAGPRHALAARADAETGSALVLDVQPAIHAVNERLALLPPGAAAVDLPQPDGDVVATSAEFIKRLAAGWLPAARGCTRLPATHRLDLVVGMHALHYVLAGNVDFATFVRQIRGDAITVGQNEAPSAWLARGDAAEPTPVRADVLNQAEGGYRLRVRAADGLRLRVGEVVGLAPPADAAEQRDWMVGVVRWLKLEDTGQVLGVQLLQRMGRAAGVRPMTVDGEIMAPQRAVELPAGAGTDGLALLLTHRFARNVARAEVALPALASDWTSSAAVDVWDFDRAEALGAACVRITLVQHGGPGAVGSA